MVNGDTGDQDWNSPSRCHNLHEKSHTSLRVTKLVVGTSGKAGSWNYKEMQQNSCIQVDIFDS